MLIGAKGEEPRRYSDIAAVSRAAPQLAKAHDTSWLRVGRRTRSQQVLPIISDHAPSVPSRRRRRREPSKTASTVTAATPTTTTTPALTAAAAANSPWDERSWSKLTRQLQRMTTNELGALLNADDEFVLDCFIDQKPIIKKLERERDEMREQVSSLAETNYAREPGFVRDRLRLSEQREQLARKVRELESKHIEPIVVKLNGLQARLARDAMEQEERCESMAQEFLANGIANNCEGAENEGGGAGAGACCNASISSQTTTHSHSSATSSSPGSLVGQFIQKFVKLRKETSRKRILADRLAKERDMLLGNITHLNK